MAKKENTASESASSETVQEGVETETNPTVVTIDHSKEIRSLEAGLKDALQEIASLNEKVDSQNENSAGVTLEDSRPDRRKEILDRAAVIAGKIASGSVIEGLLQGNHATTISLSSIRLALMLERVADKLEAYPELVTQRITVAHDKLDELIRAEDAEECGKAAG